MKIKLNDASWTLIILSLLNLTTTKADDDAKFENEPLLFVDIAHTSGLECEVHNVTTEDGYILTLFHLPGDKTRPVFLLSGNFGSADDYIARGNTSLPAVLVGAGYDVWVGNWRGCKYGRRHVTLDPDRDKEFWNYSIHEYGKYDAAAHIDYILNNTRAKKVACIGWSMGTTTFYLLGTIRSEYIDKVAVVISLAPIAYLHHSPVIQYISTFYPFMEAFLDTLNVHEITRENSTFVTLLRFVCRFKEVGYDMCVNGWFFPAFGYDYNNIEPQFTPVLFSYFPSSISFKSLRHQWQTVFSHRFSKYDYGPTENLKRYGSVTAPDYELQNNNMTVVLISGKNDPLSTLPDVEMLKALLPNVAEHVLLEPGDFNHCDFPYGKNSDKVLYKTHILQILRKYIPENVGE